MSRRKRKATAAAVAKTGTVRTRQRDAFFWLLLATGALYVAIAWVTSGSSQRWVLGMIDGQPLFAIDDAYRYYLAKTAWHNPALYAWNYMLPGPVFADGLLASLTDGNLFAMRVLHVPAALLSLWFVYRSGLRLGADRLAMGVSATMLAAMPLFAFVFLSFYGEMWLTLALSAALYCHVHEQQRRATLLFALLPLIRPEGIFFLAPLALHYLLQRRWLLLALLGAPGFVYGLYLLSALENPASYGDWRLELARILGSVPAPGMRRPQAFLETFNALWVLPAIAGFFTAPLRHRWPLWAGALLWLAWNVISIRRGLSYYEARYLLSILPLLTLGWAFCLRALLAGNRLPATAAATLFVLASLCIAGENLRQLDPLKAATGNARWPLPGLPATRDYIGTLSEKASDNRRSTAQAVAGMLAGNPAIDRVLVSNPEIFYYLDPRIERQARVIYVPLAERVAEQLSDGKLFGMYPGGTQYGYYRLHAPAANERHPALYVGRLENAGVAPVFRQGIFTISLVGYGATLKDGSASPDEAPRP